MSPRYEGTIGVRGGGKTWRMVNGFGGGRTRKLPRFDGREHIARDRALQAAKEKALRFLNAGDADGCLVAFVAATLGPPSEEFTRPTINWYGGSGWLLELGKSYIQPREIFPGFSVVDVEALRRWVQGFR